MKTCTTVLLVGLISSSTCVRADVDDSYDSSPNYTTAESCEHWRGDFDRVNDCWASYHQGRKESQDNIGGYLLIGFALYALYGLGRWYETWRDDKEKKKWEDEKISHKEWLEWREKQKTLRGYDNWD